MNDQIIKVMKGWDGKHLTIFFKEVLDIFGKMPRQSTYPCVYLGDGAGKFLCYGSMLFKQGFIDLIPKEIDREEIYLKYANVFDYVAWETTSMYGNTAMFLNKQILHFEEAQLVMRENEKMLEKNISRIWNKKLSVLLKSFEKEVNNNINHGNKKDNHQIIRNFFLSVNVMFTDKKCLARVVESLVYLCNGNNKLVPYVKEAFLEFPLFFSRDKQVWPLFIAKLIAHAKDKNPTIVHKLTAFI